MSILKMVVHDLSLRPPLTGLCAGYERGTWRAVALADYLFESLPEFCLSWSERQTLDAETAVKMVRSAAKRVYSTNKFANRGEFGELLLHVILKDLIHTVPAISKVYFKDADNDTVKGFDAVHVIATPDHLELWLGEVKFYTEIKMAIRDVIAELSSHTETDYLRREFCAIANKIDSAWPHSDQLRKLLDDKVSLDEVFKCVCIPVLLTYNGGTTAKFKLECDEYIQELSAEFLGIHQMFVANSLPSDLQLHLFLLPMHTKEVLISELDRKLKAWQQI